MVLENLDLIQKANCLALAMSRRWRQSCATLIWINRLFSPK